MLRRIVAVGLLSMASLVFASRFTPPLTAPDEIDAALERFGDSTAPIPQETTTRPSTMAPRSTVTTTTIPIPPGVRFYDSAFVNFARGVLQLRITVEWGVMVDVEMLRVPSSSRRAEETSLEAGAILRDEAIEAQHYRLHAVSGATETSWMYMWALRDVMRKAELCVDPKCDMPLK